MCRPLEIWIKACRSDSISDWHIIPRFGFALFWLLGGCLWFGREYLGITRWLRHLILQTHRLNRAIRPQSSSASASSISPPEYSSCSYHYSFSWWRALDLACTWSRVAGGPTGFGFATSSASSNPSSSNYRAPSTNYSGSYWSQFFIELHFGL